MNRQVRDRARQKRSLLGGHGQNKADARRAIPAQLPSSSSASSSEAAASFPGDSGQWRVAFHPIFESWANGLSASENEHLLAAVRLLRRAGHNAGKPAAIFESPDCGPGLRELHIGPSAGIGIHLLFVHSSENREILLISGGRVGPGTAAPGARRPGRASVTSPGLPGEVRSDGSTRRVDLWLSLSALAILQEYPPGPDRADVVVAAVDTRAAHVLGRHSNQAVVAGGHTWRIQAHGHSPSASAPLRFDRQRFAAIDDLARSVRMYVSAFVGECLVDWNETGRPGYPLEAGGAQ